MARSDIWRFARFTDKARDLAEVTQGIGSYLGSAANDRSLRVTWAPIANTYGGTDTKAKAVILNPALLDEMSDTVPFTGEAVDMMQAVSCHEAGHVLIARHLRDSSGYVIDPEQDGMVGNIVEDLMIDGPAYAAYNVGLAELTAALRVTMEEKHYPPIDDFWRNGPAPATGSQLLSSWGCGRLFGHHLPKLASRKHEERFVELLDVVADRLQALTDFTGRDANNARNRAVRDVQDILKAYEDDPETPKSPQQQKSPGKGEGEGEGQGQGQGQGDGQGSGSGQGEGGEDGAEAGSGSGKGEGKSKGDGEGDGEGECDNSTGKSQSRGGESNGGHGGTGAGSASKQRTPAQWDASLPKPCPNNHGQNQYDAANGGSESPDFWYDVKHELDVLEINRPGVQGKVHMAKYTDKKTVAGIQRAYAMMASEPSRQRNHESGRVDKHRLAYATAREDVFTRMKDKALAGNVVVIMDLSGSMAGNVDLVKASAASVYEALTPTNLDVFIYSYGSPNVAQLATPRKVFPAFAGIGAGGGTPTGAAFAAVLKDIKLRFGASNVIIHITDGVADNTDFAREQMAAAMKRGYKVINIGVGRSGQNLPYKDVSSSTQYIEDYTKLPKLMESAVKDIVANHKRRMSV